MAWTTPRTWVTGELVTASLLNTHVRDNLNYTKEIGYAKEVTGTLSFTNTGFADLDALTGTSTNAMQVSISTTDTAIVGLSANIYNAQAGAITVASWRISGATTANSSDANALYYESSSSNDQIQAGIIRVVTGLTPGTNVFEVQARVNAGTGAFRRADFMVVPR